MIHISLPLAALGLLLLPTALAAQEPLRELSPGQQSEVRDLIRGYLLENPDVLVEALTLYQQRQRQQPTAYLRQVLEDNRPLLADDTQSPAIGNPVGDVVIVEFFDYRCGFCRSIAQQLRQSLADDGMIRVVMKELPILGPESRTAARAALAAAKQGKYEEFHFALMKVPGPYTPENLLKLAEAIGMDPDQMAKDVFDTAIDDELRRTFDLAKALQINGTPAFVIGDQVIPGAIDMTRMRALIEQQRGEAS